VDATSKKYREASLMERTGWWFKLNELLNHHPASRLFGCFAKSLDVVGCPTWPGLLLNGNLVCVEGCGAPGYRFGLLVCTPEA